MMSTKRGNKKQPTDAPEGDFEAFVRESLARLCEGQGKIMQDISNLKAKVQLNEGALDKISKQFTNLNQSFEELKGELHDARCKVDEIEDSVQNHAVCKLVKCMNVFCHSSAIRVNTISAFITLKNPPARTAGRKSTIF